ncbi:unnamed protein product, partial [Amoebophrya sp. A120]
IVLWKLLPLESYEELGLVSIFDQRVARHVEVVRKISAALKFADCDHSFIESESGLGIPALLIKAHVKEWGGLFKQELIANYRP